MASHIDPSELNVDMAHIRLCWHQTNCDPDLSELSKGLAECVLQCAPLDWPPTHEGNSLVKEAIVERPKCAHCAVGAHRYKIVFSMWKNPVPPSVWTWAIYEQRFLLDGRVILFAT